jgi:hypothetical protein
MLVALLVIHAEAPVAEAVAAVFVATHRKRAIVTPAKAWLCDFLAQRTGERQCRTLLV